MKLLKIEGNDGFFLNNSDNYTAVGKINKDDILRLVNLSLNNESVEIDQYNEDGIKNQAHQIIYKSLVAKLNDLINRRQEFIDESQRLYLSEYEKYRADVN